jgi:hypothetical protein
VIVPAHTAFAATNIGDSSVTFWPLNREHDRGAPKIFTILFAAYRAVITPACCGEKDTADNDQPPARWLRKKTDILKMGEADQVPQDTALRDITNLLNRKIFVKDDAGGRSASYSLAPSR